MKYEGTFLEIICINNGYAVYDYSMRQYSLDHDRKAVPMLVFNDKKELTDWIFHEWTGKPITPEFPK